MLNIHSIISVIDNNAIQKNNTNKPFTLNGSFSFVDAPTKGTFSIILSSLSVDDYKFILEIIDINANVNKLECKIIENEDETTTKINLTSSTGINYGTFNCLFETQYIDGDDGNWYRIGEYVSDTDYILSIIEADYDPTFDYGFDNTYVVTDEPDAEEYCNENIDFSISQFSK